MDIVFTSLFLALQPTLHIFTIQFLWGLNEWREPIKKKNGVKSFSIQLKCQDLCKSQLVLSVKPLQFDSEFLTSGPLLTSSWGCFFESKVADGHHLGVLIGCRCLQVISREERSGLMCHFEIAFKCKKLSAAFTPLGVCDELWTFCVCVSETLYCWLKHQSNFLFTRYIDVGLFQIELPDLRLGPFIIVCKDG